MPSAERIPRNPRQVSPDAPSGAAYLASLTDLALASGLERFGAAPAEPLARARCIMHGRVAAGLVDGMRFTYNNIDRSTEIGRAHV